MYAEEEQLLQRYGWFYRELDSGMRLPRTPAQKHFVDVCRGKCPPETPHERAWMKARQSGPITEEDLHQSEVLCRRCGEPIPKARLEVAPHAFTCVHCIDESALHPEQPPPNHGLCKRCGAPLVLRKTRRSGPERLFLGCSTFPDCRHTESLE